MTQDDGNPFDDRLLNAIGGWQNGWGEIQSTKDLLANELELAVAPLPAKFRSVRVPCYRKRFIHKGELVDVILKDGRSEGLASWTTNLAFAERFKGLVRPDAVSGAIFEHVPSEHEVVVSIEALWSSTEFAAAVRSYCERGGVHGKALLNFKNLQGEVVLKAPLRGSEIVALTGASSPFDELCDSAGIPEERRNEIFSTLVENKIYPGAAAYTTRQAAKNAIANTIQKMNQLLASSGYGAS